MKNVRVLKEEFRLNELVTTAFYWFTNRLIKEEEITDEFLINLLYLIKKSKKKYTTLHPKRGLFVAIQNRILIIPNNNQP